MTEPAWPPLPYADWRETKETLHMYTQVVGKLRLALSPLEPEWANVPLYVSSRGLTTSPIPHGLETFEGEFDFIDHQLVLRGSDGAVERVALRGQAVADFYAEVMAAVASLGVQVSISTLPSEVPDPIRFPEDRVHHTYDAAAAHRFWRALVPVDVVMKEHRARFRGRTTLVNFFWGTFDLALTRFSGRRVEPPAGASRIYRLGADAEDIAAGFWPGNETITYPAFFAYAYPRPEGLEQEPLRPAAARWDESSGLFLLPYDAVRTADDPRRALLDFLESTYAAGARRLGWSDDLVIG